jgi:MFS transporter, putative metabolite:H+ symporter
MWITVLVCGLGYFVDIYDLILFSIVRVDALVGIGVATTDIADASKVVLDAQMTGMLIGGLLFGVLADKKGRMHVMMASILLYSVMNIVNAFATSVPMFALCRFISGIGLAGELGVAITLVAEVMPIEKRGYGTTAVASLGITGAIVAYLVHELFNWQVTFIIGGVLGLALLFLRVGVHDSPMFNHADHANHSKGDVRMLFHKRRIGRYASSIAIGLPIWFVIGILVTFAKEFMAASGADASTLDGGKAVMLCYVGLALGDVTSGIVSQVVRSRRKAVLLYLLCTTLTIAWYVFHPTKSATTVYLQCLALGVCVGYWAVFVTIAAEQFGTNLRSTVATSVPNMVRGSLVPMLALFTWLRKDFFLGTQQWLHAAAVVGGLAIVLAFVGFFTLKETYGSNLHFVED